MGVKFTARVTSLDTNLREITEGHDLNVEIRLHEMHSSKRAVWNYTRIITGLGTPGHRTFFLLRDRGIQVKWAKHAKVIQAVDSCHARHRRLVHRSVQLWSTLRIVVDHTVVVLRWVAVIKWRR